MLTPHSVSQSSSQPAVSIPSKDDSTDKERERLNHLETDAVHSKSAPQNPGESGDLKQSTNLPNGAQAD